MIDSGSTDQPLSTSSDTFMDSRQSHEKFMISAFQNATTDKKFAETPPSYTEDYTMEEISRKNKDFIINDQNLAFRTLEYLMEKKVSISLNGPSGTGKTFFVALVRNLFTNNLEHFQSSEQIADKRKEILQNKIKNTAWIDLKFKDTYKDATFYATPSEKKFYKIATDSIIKQIYQMFSLSPDQLQDILKHKEFTQKSLENNQESTEKVASPKILHFKLISWLIKQIQTKKLVKKIKSQTKKRSKTKETTIAKIIFSIDEINLIQNLQLDSEHDNQINRKLNSYITGLEDAVKNNKDRPITKDAIWIFTSVLPIPLGGPNKNNFNIIDFNDAGLQIEGLECFGKMDFDKFIELAATKKDKPTNRIQELILAIKKGESVKDYYVNGGNKMYEQLIEDLWKKHFSAGIYHSGKCRLSDKKIKKRLFFFFTDLYGLRYYRLDSCENWLEENKDKKRERELMKYYFSKLNIRRFLMFLMSNEKKGCIRIGSDKHESTEVSDEDFWFKFIKCYGPEEKDIDGVLSISSPNLNKEILRKDIAPAEFKNSSQWKLFHSGYLELNFENIGINREGFYMFTNEVKRCNLKAEFNKVISKWKKSHIRNNPEAIRAVNKYTTVKYWESCMKKIGQKICADKIANKKDVGLKEYEDFIIGYIENNLSKEVQNSITNSMKGDANNYSDSELQSIFENTFVIKQQKRVDNGVLDIMLQFIIGGNPKDDTVIIFELKRNMGEINDHSYMKNGNKNYDTIIDFDKMKKIFITSSLNDEKN